MVEYHVHYYFHSFGVSGIYQFAELFVVTEAAVYLVVVGDGVTMV